MVEIDVKTLSDKELLDIYDAWIKDRDVDLAEWILRLKELKEEIERRILKLRV